MVCEDWINKWPEHSVKSCTRTFSDHCPIFINSVAKDWGPRPFKFLNSWITHPEFDEFICKRWKHHCEKGWAGFRIKEKLKLIKADLKEWNASVFEFKERQIEEHKTEIEYLDRMNEVFGLEEEEIVKRNRVTTELMRNIIWRVSLISQKAKAKWLTDGDVNSAYFHSRINRKIKVQGLEGIMVNERWEDSVEKVKEEAARFFQKQFKARNLHRSQLPEDMFVKKISDTQNAFLEAKFSEKEIENAIWDCDSSKSPGPDGFTFAFIKSNWKNMKGEIMEMMEEFFEKGKIVRGLNSAFIVLIPEKDRCFSFKEFRPISLLSSIYKIIAKTLARRLSKVLDGMISENQSAFVGGRQILDGIVILNEIIDEANKRN